MNGAARVALVGAFAVAPVALAPGLLLAFDVTPKIVIVLAATGIVAAFPREYWSGVRAAWSDRWGRWFLLLLAARSVALVAATVFSQNPDVSFAGSRWRQLGLPVELALTLLATATLGYVWSRPERRAALLDALAVAAIPISVYGVFQYFGVDPLLPRGLYYAGEQEWAVVRPPSTFGHAGYFATWAAPAAVLLWGRAREARKPLAFAASGLLLVAIVLSGTRGALVGLLVGVIVAAPGWRVLRSRRTLAAAAIVAVAALAFALSPGGLRLRTRVIWSAQDYQGGARPWLWRDAAVLGARRPLVGHGLETFAAEYSRVRSEGLAVRYPDQVEESPHNVFLDAWVSQGLLGTAALAGLCVVALRRRTADVAAFAAALAANQFLSFTAMTEAIFLLCAVMVVAPQEPAPGMALPVGRGLRAAGAIAALGFVAFAAMLSAAEVEAERARRLVQAGHMTDAVAAFRRAEAAAPPGRSYGEWFARVLYGAETFSPEWADTGLRALAAGPSESPADAHYLAAALKAVAGRSVAEVEDALLAAVDAAPSWYKPRWKLAQALQAMGRNQEARKWAESADRLAGSTHPEVRTTLEGLEP